MVFLFIFLRVKRRKNESFGTRMARIDWIGNTLLTGATVSVLIALTWAGPVYSWDSPQILVPLTLGVLGIAGFFVFEGFVRIKEPLLPLRIFSQHPKTSIILYLNTFIINPMMYGISSFLPVYHQGVVPASPSWSAVLMLPTGLCCLPSLVLCAMAMPKWGRYKMLHIAGFAIFTLGCGMLAVIRKDDSVAKYVSLQLPGSIGLGFIITTLLPAFQGCAKESDQAAATVSWTWIRAFSFVWGIAISGVIFNHFVEIESANLQDKAVQMLFRNGDAFTLATKAFVESYHELVRSEIQSVLERALAKVFYVCVELSGLGLILTVSEEDVVLQTEVETEFGLEDGI